MRDTNESLSEKPTGSQEYTEEDYIRDTEKHVRLVQTFLSTLIQELEQRAEQHDASKFEEPEKSIFIKHTPALKGISFGSPEYKEHLAKVRVALDHHYANNKHHPEWANYNPVTTSNISKISHMNLVDLMEMFADWMASSIRYEGDIYESIRVSQERFGFSDELKQIFENTVILFNKIDR